MKTSSLRPFWDFEVEFTRHGDFAGFENQPYYTGSSPMRNLLAEEWEPLPDGLMVMRVEIYAPNMGIDASELKRRIPSKFFSECGGKNSFDLTLLSENAPPLGWFCTVHGHLVKDKIDAVQMRLHRKPRTTTPKEIARDSKEQGGFPNGFLEFIESLNAPKIECLAAIWGFLLPTQRPIRISTPKIKTVPSLAFEETLVRFKSKRPKGAVEISFNEPPAPHFKVNARFPIFLNAKCFDKVANTLSEVLKPIFKDHADNR